MPVNPRHPDDDPGFEVVDDPKPKKPAAPPARPAAPARPAVKSPVKPKVVDDDPGFEVVDAPKKPKVRVAEDDTAEEPRSKAKTKRSRRLDDEDEAESAPAGGKVDESDLSQFNDLKPGKKKLTAADKKRIRAEKKRIEREEREKSAEEWMFPSIVFGIGILMTLAAGVIIASHNAFAAVAVAVMLVLTVVETVLLIPLAIGALMIVGKLCGIEYGTLTHTIRSLAAIVALDTGLYWMAGALAPSYACFVWPVFAVLGFIGTYGLFMKFFDLDAMEARISIAAINFVTGVGSFVGTVVVVLLVLALVSQARKAKDAGPDDDRDPSARPTQQW